MKNLVVLFASILLMTIAIEGVKAQSTSTVATASAGATIIAPLTLTNNLSLEFGKIVKSPSGGTVTVTAASSPNRSANGELTFLSGDWRPAKFTVNADDNQLFSITKPGTITLNGPNSSSMSIATSISGNETGIKTNEGIYEFYIGGVLTIAANQEIGAYSGSYSVTVQYQ